MDSGRFNWFNVELIYFAFIMSLWKDIMKICEGILWIITIQYGREINFL